MSPRTQPVIAIDGPAGVGKSTAARELSKSLGYLLVDTGALYRGVALAAHERDIAWDDADALSVLANALDLGFVTDAQGSPRIQIDGIDRADDIRTPEISKGASQVSAHGGVRDALLGIQRRLGRDGGVVLEGRDIGTVVFPDAELKFFLTASAQERAQRRVGDLGARGIEANVAQVQAQIIERDRADSMREVAPLKPADDATIIDSTAMDAQQVLQTLLEHVRAWLTDREK